MFTSASDPEREGFARVINHSERGGTVRIVAIDDTGKEYGPIELALRARESANFNSRDLETGNASKGLSGGLGAGQGSWRLRLYSGLDIEPSAYVRTRDGFVTTMHEVVRARPLNRQAGAAELSIRAIARSLGVSPTTVGDYARRAERHGLTRPLPESLDDAALGRRELLSPAPPPAPERGGEEGRLTVWGRGAWSGFASEGRGAGRHCRHYRVRRDPEAASSASPSRAVFLDSRASCRYLAPHGFHVGTTHVVLDPPPLDFMRHIRVPHPFGAASTSTSSTALSVAAHWVSSRASKPPMSSRQSSPTSPPARPTPYIIHAPHQASSRSERNR